MPKISIICTVKNGEQTIKETIESVLAQSYREWEFIIVDDGSNDQTVKILEEYSSKDDRLKIIITKGIGRGKALNLAVENATGDYIVNIDADDLMHPKKIEVQNNFFKSNRHFFLLSTESRVFQKREEVNWEDLNNHDIQIVDITKRILIKNQVNHSSVMMRKDLLDQLGGYSINRKSQFDYELWLRAERNGLQLGKIKCPLVAKRIHQNQSFESKRLGHLLRSVKLQSQYILKSKMIYLLIFPIVRLILGTLPFNIRRKINKVTKV